MSVVHIIEIEIFYWKMKAEEEKTDEKRKMANAAQSVFHSVFNLVEELGCEKTLYV